jgi:SH3-like domain-containing protein
VNARVALEFLQTGSPSFAGRSDQFAPIGKLKTGVSSRLSRIAIWVFPFFLGLVSCQRDEPHVPVIGEAYVGPALLKIRDGIPLDAPVVAVVKHGDRLELLQKRRRFFRVRTTSGKEGWTDERQLLAKEDMDRLKELSARAAKMQAQGEATTFRDLNVHTQPSAQAPGFLQLKENDKFEVLTHVVATRTDLPRKPLIPPTPKKAKTRQPKPVKEAKFPPLAVLRPPSAPENWLDLSKTDLSAEEPSPEEQEKEEKEEKPVPTDDWSLIRTMGGESGWVLTRLLVMAIPDEVAQYAEGRRIVSYFSLGEVEDGDQKKSNWLWTTVGSGNHDYDFDSFRVFIWSLRRHRYETAFIERNVEGYAPVVLKHVELANSKGVPTGTYPGFSICLANSAGEKHRHAYAFIGNLVRFAGEQPCETATPETAVVQAPLPAGAAQPAKESFAEGLRRRLRGWTRGWFGG